MSYAEQAAYKLYDSMHLDSVSNDVKRQLMILILSKTSLEKDEPENCTLPNPMSLEEAMNQGCVDLETARTELHSYVDELAKEYDLQ